MEASKPKTFLLRQTPALVVARTTLCRRTILWARAKEGYLATAKKEDGWCETMIGTCGSSLLHNHILPLVGAARGTRVAAKSFFLEGRSLSAYNTGASERCCFNCGGKDTSQWRLGDGLEWTCNSCQQKTIYRERKRRAESELADQSSEVSTGVIVLFQSNGIYCDVSYTLCRQAASQVKKLPMRTRESSSVRFFQC